MSTSICLRCLKRALLLPESSPSPSLNTPHRAATFSTSPSLSANPPKKKPVFAKGIQAKAGRTLRLAKNRRVQTARPPAVGERKALRKRVVLSNTNALEVPGLEDLTTENVADARKLREMRGKVLGLGNDTVDALRALEGFKPGQGWSLLRRPAALVRVETVGLGADMQGVKERKEVVRRVIFGERGSGKSVLMLQGMAMAYLQGWIVVHFPEARDITNAHTAYQPVQTAEGGGTLYVQPHYIAHVLGNIAKANRGLLNDLRLRKQHQLPIPLQSDISLAWLVELGANDPQLAYPIWQAFLSEITAPSQPEKQGQLRPPVFVSMDGVDHIMRQSAYLDTDAKPIHAHDLAIARDFAALLSGQTSLTNGGMVLAATSASTRPPVPTLDHLLARKHAEPHAQRLTDLRDRLLQQAESASTIHDIPNLSEEASTLHPPTFPPTLAPQAQALQSRLLHLHHQSTKPSTLSKYLSTFTAKVPEWNPYEALDERVAETMATVGVMKAEGLGKGEARALMEYYARSGMLRAPVTEGLVGEKWTLAGGGNVGEIERGSVGVRF